MNARTAAVAAGTAGVAGLAFALTRRRPKDVTDERAHASRTVTVRDGALSLYDRWTAPDALPRFMIGVERVEQVDATHQRWFTKAQPRRAIAVEIVHDAPGERLEWRVERRGPYAGGGFVTFLPAPGERGTEVRLALHVTGPGAKPAAAFARLFGASPAQLAMESLRRFKALAEAGEIPVAVRR